MTYRENFQMSERRFYGPSNYKGKKPMSRTQCRRFQRKKKAERDAAELSNNKQYQNQENDQVKKPVGRKLFSPKITQTKTKIKEEEQEKDDELVTNK